MADALVNITAGVGTPIDVETVTTGAGTVNRQIVGIGDPSTGGNRAAVAAGGQLSVSANDATSTGAITAGTLSYQVALQGLGSAAFSLSGTVSLVGTLIAEASVDGGTNWVQCYVYNPSLTAPQVLDSITNPTVATSYVVMPVPGASHIRVRCTSYSSGTVTVMVRAAAAAAVPAQYRHVAIDALGAFSTAANASTFLLVDALDWSNDGAVYVSSNGSYQLFCYPLLDSSYDTRASWLRVELTAGNTSGTTGGNNYRRYGLGSLLPLRAITFELLNLAVGTSTSHIGYQFRS